MNGRILELAKNPDQFQIKDLELLGSEINKHPYIQSLRALHLLGTHRLKPENYSNELSIAAAYTTDKKILYQLINAVKETKPSVESISETIIPEETDQKNKFTEIESKVTETPKAVYVNGELNRILFEGEEDFLDRKTETIDLESSLEAGQIVTNPAEKQEFSEVSDAETFSTETIIKEEIVSEEKAVIENPSELSFHEAAEFPPDAKVEPKANTTEVQEFEESSDSESFSKETIVEEDLILQETPIVEDPSELSFHATDDFLPNVKIASNPEKAEIQETAKPALNKHEEEMKRLIAEVEEKMKASKKQKVSSQTKEESSESAEVNFSETQSFEIEKTEKNDSEESEKEKSAAKENIQKAEPLIKEKTEIQPVNISQKTSELETEFIPEEKPVWKPMSFSTNTPDALISKKTKEKSVEKEDIKLAETLVKTEEMSGTKAEQNAVVERPVFNVSFFTQNVSALEKANREEETQPIQEDEKTAEILEDSNVPGFINTWQSWLKIDRIKQEAKEKIEISITEIKNKVIENFIEKEPRISKLKEESDFVIKERNDDISHLMTETLANLYTEQKLYAKAIKAFGILSEKHPEKKPHFDDKIKQIKELRQNK